MSAKMTPQDAAVIVLASGSSQRRAAVQAACSPRTIARWLTEPAFRLRVTAARAELLDRASGRLSAMLMAATSTLRKLLSSGNEGIQLQAVKLVLEATLSMRTATEFEARLSKLEASK